MYKKKTRDSIRCKIISVGDVKNKDDDKSGKLIKDMLEREGHEIVSYLVVNDDIKEIKDELSTQDAQVYILSGGTGIGSKAVTPDAVKDVIDTELQGFGELFRSFSYKDIGPSAILCRAVAGINDRQLVFSMPCSEVGVKMGMEKLILPKLNYMVQKVKR
ncbi:MAG: MogA/MoaB family molybdenum cofactor biosynthesis protein [Thermoplasmatota archaeon]